MIMRKSTIIIMTVLILLIIVLFFFSGGVSKFLFRNQSKDIYLVVKSVSDKFEFWQMVQKGAEEAGKEFNANLVVTGTVSEEDVEGQIAIIDEIIEKKPDVIILAALDYERLVEPAKKIKSAGIKLITLDSGLAEDVSTCFVGTNNYLGGVYLGDKMNELLNGQGNIAIIAHSIGSETAIERSSGFINSINKYPDLVQYNEIFNAKDDSNTAYEYVKQLLEEDGENIDAIFATNQICSEGAGMALEQSGLKDEIVMLAFDSSTLQNELLVNGVIDGIVVQQPFNMGYIGVKHAVSLARKEKIPDVDYIDFRYIDRNNMYEEENLKLIYPFLD